MEWVWLSRKGLNVFARVCSGVVVGVVVGVSLAAYAAGHDSAFERIRYNNDGLVVDLGVGLWGHAFPVDYDGQGQTVLLVASTGYPSNGIFEFSQDSSSEGPLSVFSPGRRLDAAKRSLSCSYVDGSWMFADSKNTYPDFAKSQFKNPVPIPLTEEIYAGRDDQRRFCDYDGDGVTDLIVGTSDWREYGWDNAFNEKGEWTHGPLHGYVYVVRNKGSNPAPEYEAAIKLEAGGKPIDVYGTPSPCFADFDGDGDLDLICGEFLDKLTYFENTGTRREPHYAGGRVLAHEGAPIRLELEMLQVTAFDWDKDSHTDLIVAQEDGRVTFVKNTGELAEGMPHFLPPVFFRQRAEYLKAGALTTPFGVDWDDDGDEDLIVGNTAGYLDFLENLGGGEHPRWAAPVHLQADGEVIRIQAGPNGSVQGPAEAKWGYTVCNVADWDQDGLKDIVVNSIWGEVLWYRNAGTHAAPKLEKARPIEVAWEGQTPKPAWCWWVPKGKQLVTQWRTTPAVIDWNRDGLTDLVMLDTEGYLAFFARAKTTDGLALLPGKRIFQDEQGNPLRLNEEEAGKSGRRKFALVDWDLDGKTDILLNGRNIDFLHNIGDVALPAKFKNEGRLDSLRLAGHDTCPGVVDWNQDGVPDLVVGAEDGFFYYLKNPHVKKTAS